jgi:hypothetical protein
MLHVDTDAARCFRSTYDHGASCAGHTQRSFS